MAKLTLKKLNYTEVLGQQDLFDRLYDLVLITDRDEKVVYVNRAFMTFANISKSEVSKEPAFSSILHLIDEEEASIFERCRESRKYLGVREVNGELHGGGPFSIQVGVQPLFDGDEIAGFLINIQDKSLELQLHGKYKDVIEQLERGFEESIQAFTNIVELVENESNFHNQKVAALAKRIAEKLELKDKTITMVETAGRLHGLGKVGMSQDMLQKRYDKMKDLEQKEYRKYPVLGALIFEGNPVFDEICSYIRMHHEYYDGSGFPDGLSGDRVPMGAYAVGIANDFYEMCHHGSAPEKAVLHIQKYSESKYHPLVADAFLDVIKVQSKYTQKYIRKTIGLEDLKVGMILAENLNSSKGLLLMLAEEVVSRDGLDRIRRFHENDPITSKVSIYSPMSSEEILERKKKSLEEKKKRRILVVDDNKEMNMMTRLMLEKNKTYEVSAVYSGDEAIEQVDKEQIDGIIMDIMMPGVDGVEATRRIREAGHEMPIIMNTALSDHKSVIRAFRYGADDYFVKPTKMEAMLAGLEKAFEHHGDGQKAWRHRQMLSVLEDVAPQLVNKIRERQDKTAIKVNFAKLTSGEGAPEKLILEGALANLNKEQLEIHTIESLDVNGRIAFQIDKLMNNQGVSGLGKVIEENEGEEFNQYTIELISLKKT